MRVLVLTEIRVFRSYAYIGSKEELVCHVPVLRDEIRFILKALGKSG